MHVCIIVIRLTQVVQSSTPHVTHSRPPTSAHVPTGHATHSRRPEELPLRGNVSTEEENFQNPTNILFIILTSDVCASIGATVTLLSGSIVSINATHTKQSIK